jgi:valyl-tRNA synthetase
VRLSEERIAGYRNFANKVWNACRFTFMNLEGFQPVTPSGDAEANEKTPVEAWIMSRLQQVIRETRESLDSYAFDQAANTLYQFIWHEFCDWYLELIKPQLYDKEDAATRSHCQGVLLQVLSAVLRLLHPFMPFITEEIWQKLPGAPGSIMVAPYPQPDPRYDHPGAEAEMNLVMGTLTAIRNIRGEMNVPPGTQVEVFLASPDAGAIETLNRHRQSIQNLGRVRELHCNSAGGPPAASAKAVVDQVDIFMPLAGIIDFAEEAKRLDRELEKLGKEVNQAQRKMSNEDFLAKAPAEVVAKEQAKLQAQADKLQKLKTHRERIRELMG